MSLPPIITSGNSFRTDIPPTTSVYKNRFQDTFENLNEEEEDDLSSDDSVSETTTNNKNDNNNNTSSSQVPQSIAKPGGGKHGSVADISSPIGKKKKGKTDLKVYEIDYVGTGTFQVSQLNLLNHRSVEPVKTYDALLSSRGLHHRSKEVFVKDVHSATNIINGMKRGEKVTSSKYKPSPALYQPYFQRALAFERLQKVEKAIDDYTTCTFIDPKNSAAFFNRSGLYKIKKNYNAAVEDMNKAIFLEPANVSYRMARSVLFRESGLYSDAVKDTILSRALIKDANIARTLELGNENVALESDTVYAMKVAEDPIISSLNIPCLQRTNKDIEPIVDFLSTLKFFASFQNNNDIMSSIARKVELQLFSKGKFIFEEGDPGSQFYIIYDGEVSIVHVKKMFGEVVDTTVLVKLFRGHTFGETALESKGGLRTAGALASQKCKLITLSADDYQTILSKFRNLLKDEVRTILSASSIFQGWEQSKLDYLASFAIIKSFAANSVIMKAGEPVTSLMLIKSGIIQLVKSVPKPDVSAIMKRTANNTVIINEDFQEVPGLWILNKNWNHHLDDHLRTMNHHDFVDFTVGVLGSGQVFGELALLDPEKESPVSAMSSTAVELYCFESDILLMIGARFNPGTMKALHESLTLHDPPADKIAYYFRSKYAWELRKHRLMNRLSKKET
jgi:CRP-like cAMP-binding protein